MNRLGLVLLPALAMSVGWGFRGDYGHEAGAMVPGALAGLAVVIASGRRTWQDRWLPAALAGALGWAVGGQMSYGMVIGFTMHDDQWNVAYGFGALFIIGALWGGVGAGLFSLALTKSRGQLEQFAWPLAVLWAAWLTLDFSGITDALSERWSFHDTDWAAALSALVLMQIYAWLRPQDAPAARFIAALAAGWLVGFFALTWFGGLRMTPPRSDNWAGCVGLYLTLVGYLFVSRNQAGLLLSLYGAAAGGLGFATGDFFNVLGRGQWGAVGRFELLHNLDYWKWMEQGFGWLMGAGVALGALRLLAGGLEPPSERDEGEPRWLSLVGGLFLLVVMQWMNLFKNARHWLNDAGVPEEFLGFETRHWLIGLGALVSLMLVVAVWRQWRDQVDLLPRSSLGRAQVVFLLLLWTAVLAAFIQALPNMARKGTFFVHASFWITAAAAAIVALLYSPPPSAPQDKPLVSPRDPYWRPRVAMVVLWALIPPYLMLLAWGAVKSHDGPLPGSNVRYEQPANQGTQ